MPAPKVASAQMLICDAAVLAEGKLFMLGGGWSICAADMPLPMALAIRLEFPFQPEPLAFKMALTLEYTGADGKTLPAIRTSSETTITPDEPGAGLGASLIAQFAMQFGTPMLPAGRYEWLLRVDRRLVGRAGFLAVSRDVAEKLERAKASDQSAIQTQR
jgi:uncharacterized protein DUF6941